MEVTAEQCQDGDDNDGDGLIDCDDPGCLGFTFCVDAGADTDTDVDTDSDSDADTDTDTDTNTDTEPVCIEGSFTVANTDDLAVLAEYQCVTGDLGINMTGMGDVSLDGLLWVGNDFWIGATIGTVSFEAPNLTSIGGRLALGCSSAPEGEGLIGASFPALVSVGDEVQVSSCHGLVTLSAPALEETGGQIMIADAHALTELEVGALTTTNAITLQNIGLTDLAGFGGLTTLETDLVISYMHWLENLDGLDNLTSIGSDIFIHSNEVLTDVTGLESLTSVGGTFFQIYNNIQLPQCEACNVLDQLVGFTGSVSVYGNQADTCADDCL